MIARIKHSAGQKAKSGPVPLHAQWIKEAGMTERDRAAADLHEALIDLRDAERAVDRAKKRVVQARVRCKNADEE